MNVNYEITGGPLKATVTGTARVAMNAILYADTSTSSPAYNPNPNGNFVYAPTTYPIPTGTQTISIPSASASIDVTGATLTFTNINSAGSGSYINAVNGATGTAEFNFLNIRTTSLTIQP